MQTTFRNLISLEYGKPLPDNLRSKNGLYPVYGANGVKDRSNEYLYDCPTLIIGRKGAAGEINLSEDKFWPLDVTYFVKFDVKILDLHYLYYLLRKQNLPLLAKGVKPGLNREDVYNISIAIPSLDQQKRIAERLDKVQKLIALQKEQLKKLDELIKSRFIDLFGDPITNPKKWTQTPFHSLVKEMFIGPFGSDLKNENYVRPEQGYCVVYEQKHAIYHSINLEFRYIDETKYKQLRRFLVKPGDFIMSCRGTIGKIYQLPPQAPCGIIHSSLMKISLDMKKVNSEYFQWLLASIIKNSTKDGGVIKMAITAKNLGKKDVPIPPLSLQTQFADFVTKIESQKGLLTTRLSHLETLYKSLMQEYFG